MAYLITAIGLLAVGALLWALITREEQGIY